MGTPWLPWVQKKKDGVDLDAKKHNSAEENELLDVAQHRFEIARAEKTDFEGKELHTKWRDFDKMYRSRQWKGNVPQHKSTPVLNFTFSMIESVLPRMTSSNPEILVTARKDIHAGRLATHLGQIHSYLWYTNKMQRRIKEAVRMALKYGTCLIKTVWDPDFYGEDIGEVYYSLIHPMNFFPDPRAYCVEDMDYCFVKVPKPLEYFMRRWPEKGHLVVADNDWVDTEQTTGAGTRTQEDRATLCEYWFRDADGNVCVMYYSGHVVLDIFGGVYDKVAFGEPVYRHNKFPFSRLVDYDADKEFWGIGEIEIIEMLQRLINSFEAQIIDNTRLMANAQWMINKAQSGIKEEDAWIFDNRPGSAIFTHNGGVEKLPGVPIPNHVPEHMERLIFAIEQILGIHDVVQGRAPSGVRAASAIIALQESANVRVREKATNLEHCLQEAAEQATWLVLENYDEPRRIRIAGDSAPVTLDVRTALNERMVDMAAAAGLVEQGMSPEEMGPEQMEMIMQEVKFPDFDVEVKVGPSVPYSQALLYEQSKEFYQLGIIDRQAVLETTNFPNKEAILARIEGAMQAAAEGGEEERIGERTF